jgi:hypothetical protein
VFSVFFYESQYPIDFASTESPANLKSDRVKPEFGCIILTLNVNVRGLIAIACIKEEPIGADS